MSNNKDRFEKIQIRLVGMAVSCFVVYFWLLERIKEGLGAIYPLVQQIVACFMIILTISSGWKFVELVIKARGDVGDKLKGMVDKSIEEEKEEK